ncbi:type II CAAX endopeptidase family protein [Methanosarcina sp.]|uniref:CPBP family intramembrane glutamic endopeptidase n=1 Tax=Methanosarcina sp. TaxID=2213 RepID=UPI002988D5A7|nr:type II CAAX endopeptidase family protein [Methanosarcina sp.]MDW5549178.1 type II CAAX endopeptidase family protein [Methanosarcina sp.]MDW5559358.1 type II CAAX endopeptidase family protein [Methanosarcina sp.]
MKEGVSMKNTVIHTKQKKLNFIIIISLLSLALLAVSPAYCSDLNNSSSSQTEPVLKLVPGNTGEPGFFKFVLSNESSGPFQIIEQYVDLGYILGGFGAAFLILLMYRRMASKEQEMMERPPQAPYSHNVLKKLGLEKLYQEEYEATRIRLFTAIPVVCIIVAELLIFLGRIELGIGMHVVILIAFSLSNLVIKDLKVYRIYEALMLLPILRLVNLSMPVFFSTTLYAFVFVYGPLLVPLAIIVMHQRQSLDKIGITSNNLLAYVILSIPLGFLFGLAEYMVIKPGYLIPDLSTENLLKLTIIMVFFVGLTEELIFRSFLQTRLEEAFDIRVALVITAFLFGSMHSGYGTFYEILYTSFVGLVIGFIFYKTRSLPFVAVMHGFINVFLFGFLPYYLSGWKGF